VLKEAPLKPITVLAAFVAAPLIAAAPAAAFDPQPDPPGHTVTPPSLPSLPPIIPIHR
jgi:hypothetical protein